MPYFTEIYNENKFITKYPELNQKIIDMFINNRINKNNYTFSQFLQWSPESGSELSYYNKQNEDISIVFCIREVDGEYEIETEWDQED